MSDEIGHFENFLAIDANFNCTRPAARTPAVWTRTTATTPASPPPTPCWSRSTAASAPTRTSTGSPTATTGPARPQPGRDRALHPSPVLFTSPLANGTTNYSNVAFETDLPAHRGGGRPGQPAVLRPDHRRQLRQPAERRAVLPVLHDRHTTARAPGRRAELHPRHDRPFGGTSTAEYGPLLKTVYPATGFTTSHPLQQLQQRGPAQPLPA